MANQLQVEQFSATEDTEPDKELRLGYCEILQALLVVVPHLAWVQLVDHMRLLLSSSPQLQLNPKI